MTEGTTALAGMRSVVIGGATGIGAGIARALARRGAVVAILDRDEAAGSELAESMGADSGARFLPVDITHPETLAAARDDLLTADPRLDLVFVNAGATVARPLLDTTDEDWRWLFEVNVLGTVHCLQAFLPAMLAQPRASRLAVTSSLAVLRPTEMAGQAVYNATKSAQFGLVNALEKDLAGSRVALTTILPGPVATQLRAKSAQAYARADAVPIPARTAAAALSGDEAGEIIVARVLAGQRYVTTHPGEWPRVEQNLARIVEAFAPEGSDRHE